MRSQAQDHFWPICEKEKVKVLTLGKSSVDVDGGGKKVCERFFCQSDYLDSDIICIIDYEQGHNYASHRKAFMHQSSSCKYG